MIPTARRTAPTFLGPEFDRFLSAMVGTDRQGSQLSVVSAFARLDLDAWDEAAALARLPPDAAAQKLSAVLRKYPEIPLIAQDAGTIAARLVALLPGVITGPAAAHAAAKPWASAHGAVLGILIALGMMIGMQFVTQAANPHAASVSAAATSAGQPPAPKLP
jgi:hypothetical protein